MSTTDETLVDAPVEEQTTTETPEEELPSGHSSGEVAPTILLLSDVLSSRELIQTKELDDKTALEQIGVLGIETLRTRLIQWVTQGYPPAFTIADVRISLPSMCSDGVCRCLAEYIVFCSGKTIQEHIAVLQSRLPDVTVSFAYTGSGILVVVSKAEAA
jgi:hypothetical protein